ncbi:UDP:flavonoid glycosyltransferase YjiC (YdhE family) [Kitasatospora sp. MAA19]|nr:UDP:flavonoid glycosyltransferase YjiC (YdhE family) [Kitasatospora sp. MAA19]
MDLLDPRVRSLADAITSALANPAYRRNAKHMAQ